LTAAAVEPSIVQPLVLAVKLWASSNELNVLKNTCRLTSYSLTLMVIQYLQGALRLGYGRLGIR